MDIDRVADALFYAIRGSDKVWSFELGKRVIIVHCYKWPNIKHSYEITYESLNFTIDIVQMMIDVTRKVEKELDEIHSEGN